MSLNLRLLGLGYRAFDKTIAVSGRDATTLICFVTSDVSHLLTTQTSLIPTKLAKLRYNGLTPISGFSYSAIFSAT